jgi:hypothetical protein
MLVDRGLRKSGACTGNADILDSHPPFHLCQLNARIVPQILRSECEGSAYMVFQLKFPSYAILRRCGKLVKSNLLRSISSPGKKVSNDTAPTDKAANSSPVEVK